MFLVIVYSNRMNDGTHFYKVLQVSTCTYLLICFMHKSGIKHSFLLSGTLYASPSFYK